MSDAFTPYETGLAYLLERLGQDHPRYTEALTLEAQLRENVGQARLDGDTEIRRADRSRILRELNRLALETVQISFNTLCGLSDVETDSASVALPQSEIQALPPTGDNATEEKEKRQLVELIEGLRQRAEGSKRASATEILLQHVKGERRPLERDEVLKALVEGAEGASEQAALFASATGMRTSHQLKVFLGHAAGDERAVRDLYRRLRSDGVAPWLDEEDLMGGQDKQEEISKAVRSSHAVIICLSSRAITKTGYVQKEIKHVLDVADGQPKGTILLIPLRLEECEVPKRLRSLEPVDLFEKKGYERLLRALGARAESLGLEWYDLLWVGRD